jgi:hypothetical protein
MKGATTYATKGDDSSVHVWKDPEEGWLMCSWCSLTYTFVHDEPNLTSMIAHLEEHRTIGDLVPESALERLRAEVAKAPPGTEYLVTRYQVWLEGYAATGERGTAQFFGTHRARSFTEAVEYFVEVRKLNPELFDKGRLMYWGCRFYDNERQAREHFG